MTKIVHFGFPREDLRFCLDPEEIEGWYKRIDKGESIKTELEEKPNTTNNPHKVSCVKCIKLMRAWGMNIQN